MQLPNIVVYGSFPTSNHNSSRVIGCPNQLFMGLFLHQTTTFSAPLTATMCCLWVFSYIKPQRSSSASTCSCVVYGSFPTSNHNLKSRKSCTTPLFMGLFLHQTTTLWRLCGYPASLFMGLFLHQTTTNRCNISSRRGCLWVFSYIKPQHYRASGPKKSVVYGSFPTSNHNASTPTHGPTTLFMGLFLHQTTT